ncbi:MAG TPA: hypothetical protein V6C58_15230 [Allocoleopsis sp.]
MGDRFLLWAIAVCESDRCFVRAIVLILAIARVVGAIVFDVGDRFLCGRSRLGKGERPLIPLQED